MKPRGRLLRAPAARVPFRPRSKSLNATPAEGTARARKISLPWALEWRVESTRATSAIPSPPRAGPCPCLSLCCPAPALPSMAPKRHNPSATRVSRESQLTFDQCSHSGTQRRAIRRRCWWWLWCSRDGGRFAQRRRRRRGSRAFKIQGKGGGRREERGGGRESKRSRRRGRGERSASRGGISEKSNSERGQPQTKNSSRPNINASVRGALLRPLERWKAPSTRLGTTGEAAAAGEEEQRAGVRPTRRRWTGGVGGRTGLGDSCAR